MSPEVQTAATGQTSLSLASTLVAWAQLLVERRLAWLEVLAGGDDSDEAEAEWLASQDPVRAWSRRQYELELALFGDRSSRFAQLSRIFGLTEVEQRLLALTLADALDPRLSAAWLGLDQRRRWGRLTPEVAARLCGEQRTGGWPSDAAVFRWEFVQLHVIEPGLPPAVSIDPAIRDWCCGRSELDPWLVGIATITPVLPALDSWPVEAVSSRIRDLWAPSRGARIRCLVYGAPGSGRKTFAAAVAGRLGIPLLRIDASAADEDSWARVAVHAERQAYLDGCALAWQDLSGTRRRSPTIATPYPLQFEILDLFEGPAPAPGMVDLRIDLALPRAEERARLWRQALPSGAAWPPEEIDAFAARHRATPAEIRRIALLEPGSAKEAARLLREASVGRLGPLAQRIDCPFTLSDLVAAPAVRESLEDFAFEAASRALFWESDAARRLFPQGRGLAGLFSGPPGTGKTMAAQCIASELQLDVYRIDLSAIVSKWVGETAQNIERLLRQAASLDIVLLFDEADALFAKRSAEVRDAQDKFANIDAGHLLTAIENYPGIVILTTNLKGNIDGAFLRRVRYVVDFAKPDAAQRLELWRRTVTALAGAEAVVRLNSDLARLADSVEATGAQIKYAVLGGVFRSRREGADLRVSHLLRGLNRELMKEGRALGARETRRLEGDGVS